MGKRKEIRRSYGTVPQRVLDLLRPGTQSMQLYNAYVTVRIVTGDNAASYSPDTVRAAKAEQRERNAGGGNVEISR